MEDTTLRRPVQPGEPAPDFEVLGVNREGKISSDQFRGRSSLLLGLFVGLHCPFCRRHLASLSAMGQQLRDQGVDTLGIVITPPERARLYFRHRPTRILIAADPDRRTHAAFGVPEPKLGPETHWPETVAMQDLGALPVQVENEVPNPTPLAAVAEMLNARDGYELTEADMSTFNTYGGQMTGLFLMDRSGMIRWSYVEGERGLSDIGKFPKPDEFLSAASRLQ
jgi:peroxiredoxin